MRLINWAWIKCTLKLGFKLYASLNCESCVQFTMTGTVRATYAVKALSGNTNAVQVWRFQRRAACASDLSSLLVGRCSLVYKHLALSHHHQQHCSSSGKEPRVHAAGVMGMSPQVTETNRTNNKTKLPRIPRFCWAKTAIQNLTTGRIPTVLLPIMALPVTLQSFKPLAYMSIVEQFMLCLL